MINSKFIRVFFKYFSNKEIIIINHKIKGSIMKKFKNVKEKKNSLYYNKKCFKNIIIVKKTY